MSDGSQTNMSSIDSWLDDHPNQPRDYVFEQPQSLKRKRKIYPSGQPLSTRAHERRQLMEISGNTAKAAEHSPDRKLRSSRQGQRPATPTRQGRPKNVAQQPTSAKPLRDQLDSLQEIEDMEQTPRPNPLDKVPILRPRPHSPQFDAPPNRGESSESGESRGSKKARSRSPTKRLTDLQFSDMPVDSETWSSDAIPLEMEDLVADMEAIGSKIETVPLAVKDKFAGIKETVYPFQWVNVDGKSHGKGTEKNPTDKITGGLGHERFWDRVSLICQATNECLKGHDPEPAWNEEVHSRILRLALQGHWGVKEVWYKNITVARISDKSLMPWNIATGAMQSKMVDYAIVINPSQSFTGDPSKFLYNHIIEKLRAEKAGASINQTAAEWVRFKPIAVNIETKRGAVSEDEAHVQLATWLTAQYSRLIQLMPDKAKTKLPSFPVLSVQGQRWLLMIASLQENNRINLIKELYLGDTGSIAGVYQVVAAIRRVAQWVNDDYRPWFEREILGIKAGVISRP